MRKINAIIASLTLAGLGQVVYQNSEAAPVCEDGICEVVFTNTNSAQSFQVPAGVIELEFEVYGAQGGGNSGGQGGFVSGVLTNLPAEITVMVGGAGGRGDQVPGGFNGGGISGGGEGPPGSGGGASDLRFGSDLADRVVVAGGGGGQGGPFGGFGGAGGGQAAEPGIAGQGDAGGGGTQNEGGAGGETNSSGGSDGTAGQLGVGGDGGYDSRGFGGGAGGGGYYGGGGGGADTDICCLDAGGGGGGSSFANTNHTSSVNFQPGTRAGDGLIIVRYQKPAEITDFSYQQLTSDSAVATLSFDAEVSSVELSDFAITGCSGAELTSETTTHSLNLTDCNSTPEINIKAGTMGENQHLPISNLSMQLSLDQVAPSFDLVSPTATNLSSFDILVRTDESGTFDFQDITHDGCEFVATEQDTSAVLSLSDCPEGEVLLILPTTMLSDEFGNQSIDEPMELSIQIDLTAPTIQFQETVVEKLEEPVAEITSITPVVFSETPASFELFIFEGNQDCSVYSEQIPNGLTLVTKGCSAGEVSWTLPAESLQDSVGNLGPVSASTTRFTIPEALIEETEPEDSPESEPEPTPESEIAPDPITDEETNQDPDENSESETDPEVQPEPELEPAPEPDPNPEQNPEESSDSTTDSGDAQPPIVQPSPAQEDDQSAGVIADPGESTADSESEVTPTPNPDLNSEVEQPAVETEEDVNIGSGQTESPQDVADSLTEETQEQVQQSAVEDSAVTSESDESGGVQNSDSPASVNRDIPEAVFARNTEPNQSAIDSEQSGASVWAIAIAALLVLGLIVAVVMLTKNNRSRAID